MPVTTRSGRVRAARITDLAAVGELSRLAHRTPTEMAGTGGPGGRTTGGDVRERHERPTRSLGLPVTASHVSRVQSLPHAPGCLPAPRSALCLRGGRPAGRSGSRGARHQPRRVDRGRAGCRGQRRRRRHPLPARAAPAARWLTPRRLALPRRLRRPRRQRGAVHAGRLRALWGGDASSSAIRRCASRVCAASTPRPWASAARCPRMPWSWPGSTGA